MLDRVKNLVSTLVLLALPGLLVTPDSRYSLLDRVKNPILVLELSKRYKSKAYVIASYVAYFVCVAYSLFILILAFKVDRRDDYYRPSPYTHWIFGELFGPSALSVVGVIFLVVPALAATSVAGERRRGTLMPVQLSLLRPSDIVWGKVVASIAPVLFPIAASVVTLLSFSLSMSMLDIANAYRLFGSVIAGVALVALSVAVSVVCVLFSTFAKSSAAAIVMSYGLFFSMIVIMPIVGELTESWAETLLDGHYNMGGEITFGLSLLVGIVGPPPCFLWACSRLRLPAKK